MKIRFCAILALLAAFCLISLTQDANAKKEVFELDEVYPLAKDGTIYLRTGDADVKITGSDRKDVHLIIDYEAKKSGIFWDSNDDPFEVDVRAENGNLYIREYDQDKVTIGVVVTNEFIRYDITLEVPQEAKLKITGDDDNYDIRDVQGRIAMSFDDGEALLHNCIGGDYDFEVEDGSIEMIGGSGMLSAFIEDGELFIEDAAFDEIIAEVEDGDIEIATTLKDGGRYRLGSDDGDIMLTVLSGGGEFQAVYDDGRVRASGEFIVEDEDEEFTLYKLPGGTAKVKLRTEDGRIKLSR